jgi:Fe-S oxidoreductase
MKTSEMLAEEYLDRILKCSECGFCQAVCPVFASTLRPAYNTRGKMMILKEILEEPRNILRSIPGIDYVEMAKNRLEARCCGGGGGMPGLQLGEEKI